VTNALGLDLGASGIRGYLAGESKAVAEISLGATAGNREADAISLIRQLAKDFPEHEISTACLGMSGYSSLGVQADAISDAIAESFGAKEVIVTSDMVTSHFAHFKNSFGVVVVVGTGSLAFGIGAKTHARIDGLGATLGDFGSGYWIGHQAIRLAMRASETTADHELLAALEGQVGPSDQWPRLLAKAEISAFEIAGLAKIVSGLATNGQALAVGIMHEAGEMAATSAIRCATKVDVSNISYGGSVLSEGNPVALSAFLAAVSEAGFSPEPMVALPGQGALEFASSTFPGRTDYLAEKQLATKRKYK
jgi:N-acetylglucosamine kinase-like BadF-type ATPase